MSRGQHDIIPHFGYPRCGFLRLRYHARPGGQRLDTYIQVNTEKPGARHFLKKKGLGALVSAAFFRKSRPEDASSPQKREVWPSPCRELARSCRRSLSLITAASSAGLTAPRINKMLSGGHRVCHFAGGQRICVWPICSSRAGVELRREQPMGTRPKTMMVGKGRFRRPCSALQRSEPSP